MPALSPARVPYAGSGGCQTPMSDNLKAGKPHTNLDDSANDLESEGSRLLTSSRTRSSFGKFPAQESVEDNGEAGALDFSTVKRCLAEVDVGNSGQNTARPTKQQPRQKSGSGASSTDSVPQSNQPTTSRDSPLTSTSTASGDRESSAEILAPESSDLELLQARKEDKQCFFSQDYSPADTMMVVCSFLGVRHLGMIACVNSELASISSQDYVWKQKVLQGYPDMTEEQLLEFAPAKQAADVSAYDCKWKHIHKVLGEAPLRLSFTKGPKEGEDIIVWPSTGASIGRSRSNSICLLLDDAVSRKHAVIEHTKRGFWLRDVGSSNGSWLRQACLPQHISVKLRWGDEVEVGVSAFTVTYAAEEIYGDGDGVET